MLVKAKIEFHLLSPSRNAHAGVSPPLINALRGAGSGRISSICTLPGLQQDSKLASPPRGFLEADDSAVQCKALQPVHLMSNLPKSWPVHLALWLTKDKGTRDCACCICGT